jgi:Tol biopolymer transport system component
MVRNIFLVALLLLSGNLLYAQPRATGEPRAIARIDKPLRTPVWSPDGTKLALTSLHNDGIWVVSEDASDLKQITTDSGAGYRMKWSDDNQTITARTSLREKGRIFHEVKAYNTTSGKQETLLKKTRATHALAYWNETENALLQQMIDKPAEVASQVAGLQALDGSLIFNPVLSPQGDKIVFQAGGGKGLYICNADGTELRNLGQGERPSWTPDGKYVVVMLIADDGEVITQGELLSIDVATGTRTSLLASKNYVAVSPAVSPDGKKLAFEEYATGAIYVIDIK